ncbi:hypothetical protein [Streptomyces sp. NPDC001054]
MPEGEVSVERDGALLSAARARLGHLVALIETAPFSAGTEEALRSYLAVEAGPARAAFERWSRLPESVRKLWSARSRAGGRR